MRQAGLRARLLLGLSVAFGVLGTAAIIAQMVFLSRIVGGVFLDGQALSEVGPLLLLLAGAIAVRAVLAWAEEVAARTGALRVKTEIRGRLFAKITRLGPAYTAGERSGELVTTATDGVDRLEGYAGRYLPQVPLSAAAPLLIAAYVFPIDWSSSLLLLVTAPVIPVMMAIVGSYSEEHMYKQWDALSRTGAYFLDVVQGLTTLKVLNRSHSERGRVAEVSEEFRSRTMRVLRYAFLSGLVLEFMTAVAIGVVAVVLGVRLISGSVAFEDALLVLILAPEFYKPLRELGSRRHDSMEGEASAVRILQILQTPGPSETADTVESAQRPTTAPPTISVGGLRYTYPEGQVPALDGVSLELPAGLVTAVAGPSGAGKSTLASLLLRFAEPQEGTIHADGVPVTGMPAETWRRSVAYVGQRPHLFYGSLLENLRLARPDAAMEDVEEAVRMSGLTELVERLPHGYETQLGERAARLSGGEAQRVAVARAFLKDAPVLVLDEPTSELDPEAERLIRDSLFRLMRGRTVLLIAHRLSTIRHADRVYVLDEGRVVESGDHDSLLREGGLYARLVDSYGGVAV
ncbi:thiol reductant ABC exporter subunit CydD [Rubrobacter aplysinae]|uniref:thiol reductant ABC exporter subunit CydD n=1 Tax=Rubrobacter aplysinae TaxID=909625 RepID=UPI00064BD954